MTNHAPCLIDDAAAFMKVQYLSDLRFLSTDERAILATFFSGLDVKKYTLFQWNDAIMYLVAGTAAQSVQTARNRILRAIYNNLDERM